jgi:restriction endonuclease S subunit
MKPIFVGLNPGKTGSALHRFHNWCDIMGIQHYSFMNLSGDPNWDFKYTTLDKDFICTILKDCCKIVCWGDKVSSYLTRLGFEDHFVLPHPSGLNRKINDIDYVNSRLEECKQYVFSNN